MGGLLVVVLALLIPASAVALTDYTWTGGGALGAPEWSTAANWAAGAPSGSVGTLTFPALTGGACTAEPPTATCYESHNDRSGLSATELAIDGGVGYFVDGNSISLGSGGIDAFTSGDDFGFGVTPDIALPITLTTPQTWTIHGGSDFQELAVEGNVSGAEALEVQFSGNTSFLSLGNAEVGAVTAKGEGGLGVQEALNGSNGNPISLTEHASLYSLFGQAVSSGPLTTAEDDFVVVGQSFEGGAGTLHVNGGVTLDGSSTLSIYIDQPGTAAGVDFSQLGASGEVKLEGAHLNLTDGTYFPTGGPACESLSPGDVDTLVTTTGALTGTFDGIPDESTVPIQCPGSGTSPTARIDYTAHTVTATILSAGGNPPIPTTTALHASSASLAIGDTETYTATVTPESSVGLAPSGSVEFTDGGVPIGACSARPLVQTGSESSSATCTLSYAAAGAHSIAASYAGRGHFAGSSANGLTVTVHGAEGGGSAGGGGSAVAAAVPISAPVAHRKKPLKCKKGFKKARVHGKARCVKVKGKRGRR